MNMYKTGSSGDCSRELGLRRCCFFCVFHVVSMGSPPGNGELLLQGTDRGMEMASKTAGTGWTEEWENDKLKIKPAGTGYCKSIGEEFREKVSGEVLCESFGRKFRGKSYGGVSGESSEGSPMGKFREKFQGKLR